MSDPLQVLGTTIFDRYDVVEFLGQHGSRCVYRGLHRAWGEPVQIELLVVQPRTEQALADSQRRAFVRAGKDVARLSSRSPAVVQARDGGMLTTAFGEFPCVVSEFVEGTTLRGAFELARAGGRTRYATELVFEWFADVCDALELMHGAGLVHGQIDTESLRVVGGVLGPRGVIKITSMADAAYRGALPGGGLPSAISDCPAPELRAGDASLLGAWTDVFGIASVMLELMTGEREREAQIAKLPKEQRFAFEKALAARPDQRFKTVGAFRQALGEGIATRVTKKQRNPRRTMVVSEQMSEESSGSAGSFEAVGEDSGPTPTRRPPKARVRLAFTQVAMPVTPEGKGGVRRRPARPVGAEPTPPPVMAQPAPVHGVANASFLPLLVAGVVALAVLGAVLGYLLSAA